MTLKVKALIAVVAVTILVGIGWTARGWLEDSKDLAAMKAQQTLADKIREGQAEVSRQVADHLSKLEGTERVIDRGIIREVNKPVYQRVCLPDNAIRLLNAAAKNQSPGEPDGEVPEDPAGAD